MAFSVSAIQLVNRVRRLRRMPDVGAIVETEDLATLDALNASIEEVLSSRRWEFDMRRGQMTLRPVLEGLTVTSNDPDFTLLTATLAGGLEDADTYGDYIVRVLLSGATDLSQTSIRALRASTIFLGTSTIFTCSTDIRESLSSAEASLLYSEYILPDTVRNIVRVTHQQEDLALNQIDPVVEFDELYPRPNIEYGPPELISVGGFDSPTLSASDTSTTPGLRMVVWPIPDQAYVLDYTYHYRHPELEGADDVLEGVPSDVLYQIVDLAAAKMKAYYEKDYDALRLSSFSSSKLGAMHSQQGGMYADRKPVGNWDGTAGRFRGTSWLGGRTIGGG